MSFLSEISNETNFRKWENTFGARLKHTEKNFSRKTNFPNFPLFSSLSPLSSDYESKHQEIFSDVICSFVDSIDLSYCLITKKIDKEFSLEDLIKFSLDYLSSKSKTTCVAVSTVLRNLTIGLIKIDQDVLLQRNSEDNTGKNDEENKENNQWHILDAVRSTLETYQVVMSDYIEDFRWVREKNVCHWKVKCILLTHFKIDFPLLRIHCSFKSTELENLADIPENIAFSYLLLWNSILNFCSKAPAELRSVYAKWITVYGFQDVSNELTILC